MKIITKIKQISTGLTFDISSCKFYSDLVHYSQEYDDDTFIPNNDWEFIEEETCSLSFSEMNELRQENAKKRTEIVEEAWVLFPVFKHPSIIHEFRGINLNNPDVAEVLFEKNKQAGVDATFEEVISFVKELQTRTFNRLDYIKKGFEKYKDLY